MIHILTLAFTALTGLLVIAMPVRTIVTFHHEASLEGDSDAGGESDTGNTAVSVANGIMGSVGAGSAALNNKSSGSTAAICTIFGCASAAQSDGNVSTTATSTNVTVFSPIINFWGPIEVFGRKLAR